jgi:hypothetical protein
MMAVQPVACTSMSYQDAGSTFGRSERRRQWRAAPRLLFAVLVAVLMAGCTGGGGPSGPAGSPSGPPGEAPSQSLELASPKSPAASEGTYTGVLGSDAIEGGCVYLQAADGTRYEVIYPDGWELRKAPVELVAPDGRVVARAGDEVTVTAHEADMASICMIGPIIQATEVVVG